MRKVILIGISFIFGTLAFVPEGPTLSFAQNEEKADGTGNITVVNATTCTTTVNTIQCDNGKKCGYNKKVWWDVKNDHTERARVAVVNLKHQATGLYLDPLQGPGNQSEHVVVVDENGATETLKTRVRKQKPAYFPGLYDYKVAVSFYDGTNWSDWAICLDPMIDIDG